MNWLELRLPPIVVAAIAIAVAWWSGAVNWGGMPMPELAKNLNLVFLWAGFLVILSAVRTFNKANTTVDPRKPSEASQLVSEGIFKFSRNPMYLGMLLLVLGSVLRWGSVAGLISLPLFVLYMNRFQILPEERVMAHLFGEEYQQYKSATPRWLLFK